MRNILIAFSLSLPLWVSAAEKDPQIVTDTDWMELKQGAKDSKLGAQVESVTETEEQGVYRVEVSLPKLHGDIEEVIAIGRREKVTQPALQNRRFELINDLENDRSGLVIYVGKHESFALKFNYYDASRPRNEGDKLY